MLSVLIVNFNSGQRLARCLECLSRQTFRDFEIIVFDNASTDQSVEAARRTNVSARFVENAANIGFAAANNRAAEMAKGEWLVFLNPDAYAESDWLEKLTAATAQYPFADAFGSTQINAGEQALIDGAGDVLHAAGIAYRGHFGWPVANLPPDGECFSSCAAAAMYRKKTFDELGGFDERFFCYGEDVDLGMRLRLSGGRSVQIAGARVLHEGSGVTGRHSDFSVYHGHRNRIWLARKNFPALLFWGLLPLRLLADLAILVRMALIGRFSAARRALADGYFGGGAIRVEASAMRGARRITQFELVRIMEWSLLALATRRARLTPVLAGEGEAESGRTP